MRIRKFVSFSLLVVVTLTVLAGGCGYSHRRPFRSDVKTIWVKPFATKVFRRRIEMDLTTAIKRHIQMKTPYKLANAASADTILKGEVLDVKQATMGRDFRRNVPRETQLTLLVSFEWKDMRTGKILLERKRWLQTYDYALPVGETEATALQGVIDRMAERIVEQMEQEW